MQAIWSRANRPITSSCRCKWCLSTPASALRKPILGSGNGQLQLKHLKTTLLYSTLIATAAAVDVKVKKNRRTQWDAAIEQAERSLHSVAQDSKPGVVEDARRTPSKGSVDPYTNVGYAIEDASVSQQHNSGPDGEVLETSRPKALRTSTNRYKAWRPPLAVDLLLDEASTISASGSLQTFQTANASSESSDPFRRDEQIKDADQTRKSYETILPKKILRLELTTARLVTIMMLHTIPGTGSKEIVRQRTELRGLLRDIDSKLSQLRTRGDFDVMDIGRLQYPRYNTTSPAFLQKSSQKLFGTVADLATELIEKPGERQEIIEKIAYNLMVSPAPPDTNLYSVLLSSFSYAGEMDMANSVVRAFFSSFSRGNNIIVHNILEHTRVYEQHRAFDSMVHHLKRVRGLEDPVFPSDRAARDVKRRKRKRTRFHLQSVRLDRDIFHSIIPAYLARGMLHEGLQTLSWMRSEAVEPDVTSYKYFLSHFLNERHWERGFGIWQDIEALLSKQGPADLSTPGPIHGAYSMALELCWRCKKRKEYNRIFEDARKQGYIPSIPKDVTSSKMRQLHESISNLEKRAKAILEDLSSISAQVSTSHTAFVRQRTQHLRAVYDFNSSTSGYKFTGAQARLGAIAQAAATNFNTGGFREYNFIPALDERTQPDGPYAGASISLQSTAKHTNHDVPSNESIDYGHMLQSDEPPTARIEDKDIYSVGQSNTIAKLKARGQFAKPQNDSADDEGGRWGWDFGEEQHRVAGIG